MKSASSASNSFDKVIHWLTLRGPAWRFERWLATLFKVDYYRLDEDKVLTSKGLGFRLSDVLSWQEIYINGGVSFIAADLAGGRRMEFSDKYQHLYTILHSVLSHLELPFTAL